MKISIVTAVYNCGKTIEHAIRSIIGQTYDEIEHIVVDGKSTDDTLNIIRRYRDEIAKVVSEPDNGIYDALNKGIRLASGDVVGILHGNDFYGHEKVLHAVANAFERYEVDSCYGDLQYVHPANTDRVMRHWKTSPYTRGKFKEGWMPPHPTFFVRRELYDKYGYFDPRFRIAADYELMLRFLEKHGISTYYIPQVLVKMRVGGKSNRSLRNMFIKSCEDYKSLKINGLDGGVWTIFLKNITKIPQFFVRP